MLLRLSAVMSLLFLSACSTGQLVARGAAPLIDNGVTAMNRETDLGLARASMPANLKMLEALLVADPGNTAFQLQAAMGFYGYSMAFIEPAEPVRAASLYQRARAHALVALDHAGMSAAILNGDMAPFEKNLASLGPDAVPALFWTASTWGKWIELQLDDPARLAELPRVEAMMQRVQDLDETYYYGGAHLFFGAYYGGRAPMFGGDFARAARHFDRAAEINHKQLLLVDVYRARYLLRQMGEREAFHSTLIRVIETQSYAPDFNLANAVAKQEAAALLAQEKDLF
ncbi:TRAP transporter TatT component family protein [Thiobacillus sp.]|uniref:TRAP transporter TatT component family protein n=1 Tax=Thiobacillus sp. TaxID=924 RepID=UPI00286EB3BD|nr:TRAP transporter TatT component family protein [Thiobacillus sp.]